MRKKIIYKIILSLFLFCGCSDFLDENPDDRMEIETLDQVAEVLVKAYPSTSYLFTDWYTDDCSYISSNTQMAYMTDAFEWKDQDVFDGSDCAPVQFWMSCFSAIAQANTAMEKLKTVDGDEEYKKVIKGEALLCRAYAHFMLASLWTENYDEATAKTNLGIPYVVEVEDVLVKEYSRGTLQETYDAIEKDIIEGMKLISDEYYDEAIRYHFTTTSARALACRFYLFKKDYDKVIEYASAVLGDGTVDPMYCKDLEEWYNSSVMDMFYDFVDSTDPSNLLIVEKTVGVGLRFGYGYRTHANTWDTITWDGLPWGGVPYFNIALYGDGARVTRRAVKFVEEFYKESLTATTGYPFYVHPVFRGEELIFNRAEAHIMKGEFQLALDDLNAMAPSRYFSHWMYGDVNPSITLEEVAAYYETENVGLALFQLLLDAKRREFAQEGMRWFDIKRLGLPVTHVLKDKQVDVLTSDDKRRVLQIPYSAQVQGIEKNPRD